MSESAKNLLKKLGSVKNKVAQIDEHIRRSVRGQSEVNEKETEDLFFSLVRLDRCIEIFNSELKGESKEYNDEDITF